MNFNEQCNNENENEKKKNVYPYVHIDHPQV